MEPKKHPSWNEKSSEPNLHDFGFKMLVFQAVFTGIFFKKTSTTAKIILTNPKSIWTNPANIIITGQQNLGITVG